MDLQKQLKEWRELALEAFELLEVSTQRLLSHNLLNYQSYGDELIDDFVQEVCHLINAADDLTESVSGIQWETIQKFRDLGLMAPLRGRETLMDKRREQREEKGREWQELRDTKLAFLRTIREEILPPRVNSGGVIIPRGMRPED